MAARAASLASGESVISASAVQDGLFDLWGEVRDTPSVTIVEKWLSLTIERELFSGKELLEYWIPAGELETFNDNLVGRIELIHEFRP